MALLKIFTFPDVVLAQKAVPIARVEKPLHKTADDMLETMYHAPGVGLAANQVGILERILVLDCEYEQDEDQKGNTILKSQKPIIVINPEIIAREGSLVFEEGCLSVPEYHADVKRAEKIKLKYQDIDGVSRELSAEGLLAVAIQHEIDHLDGKLFIDRLSPLKKEFVKKQLRQERVLRDQDPFGGPRKKKGSSKGGKVGL